MKPTAHVIAIAMQKGGTGKTTTATALAQAAAAKGLRVLAIDLDPQGNLTFSLGGQAGGKGSYELLNGSRQRSTIQATEQGIDLIASSWALSTVTTGQGSARRLQTAIGPLKKEYDLIIIDTPPTGGELQYNALQAATGLVIPLQADVYNIQSLYQITDTARQIQRSNRGLSIKGIVFTQYDGRSTITRQMRETIEAQANKLGVPALGTIRGAVAVKEATALQQSLYKYAPKSNPAKDYMTLLDALL